MMRKYFLLTLVTGLVILCDQLAKLWVVNNVLIGQTVPILEGLQPYLQITRTSNTGFAFGMASGNSSLILVLSSAITLGLLWMYTRTDDADRLQHIGLAIVIGGALGNIIDRIRVNYVIDFVHVKLPGMIDNVSNFADHFVIIGVSILIIDSFLYEHKKPKNTATDSSEDNVVATVED